MKSTYHSRLVSTVKTLGAFHCKGVLGLNGSSFFDDIPIFWTWVDDLKRWQAKGAKKEV
jgi:hypothetical protein